MAKKRKNKDNGQLNLFSTNTNNNVTDSRENTIIALIRRRRRQILIHSCIYYRLNDNIIDDYKYDMWGKELGRLQTEYPEISAKVPDFYEYFKDYTPECTSGYNLPIWLPEVISKAEKLLDYHYNVVKKELKNNETSSN